MSIYTILSYMLENVYLSMYFCIILRYVHKEECIMSFPDFRSEKVSGRITRLFALSGELMYLVEGSQRAALLDTGSGIGFFKPLVESLTDKPVIVLITHGHIDHAMGASEFPPESVYINHEDAYIYAQHSSYAFRCAGLPMMGPAGENIVPDEDFTPERPISDYNDLREGDRFDLGGVSVEIYACPGHTRGSLVMLIPEEHTVLLGDACNSFTFMFQDYSTSLSEFRSSLVRLGTVLAGKYDHVLSSHGDGNLVKDVIKENIMLCDRILAGKDDAAPMEFMGSGGLVAVAHGEPGHGNIVYNPDNLR